MKIKYILAGVLVFIGLAIFSYPAVASIWNEYVSSKLVSTYTEIISNNVDIFNYDYEYERAASYNARLKKEKVLLPKIVIQVMIRHMTLYLI